MGTCTTKMTHKGGPSARHAPSWNRGDDLSLDLGLEEPCRSSFGDEADDSRRPLGKTGVDVTILTLGTWKSPGLDRLLRFVYDSGIRS